MVFYFLRYILKIKIYEITEFMVNIFICEFFALILYISYFLLINYTYLVFARKKLKYNIFYEIVEFKVSIFIYKFVGLIL